MVGMVVLPVDTTTVVVAVIVVVVLVAGAMIVSVSATTKVEVMVACNQRQHSSQAQQYSVAKQPWVQNTPGETRSPRAGVVGKDRST